MFRLKSHASQHACSLRTTHRVRCEFSTSSLRPQSMSTSCSTSRERNRSLMIMQQPLVCVACMPWLRENSAQSLTLIENTVGAVWLCRGFAQFVALDPFRQHWWFKDPEEKRIPHTYPEMNFTERLQFNLSHATIARGIGWNWKIKNVPTGVPKGTSKASYLWWEAEHFMVAYLVQDIGRSHLWTVPWVQSDGKEGVPVKDLVGYRRVEMVLMLVLMTYIQMDLPYRLLSILGVYVGFWPDVADAVPTYGKLSECWSLRRFWGRVFHQTYRPVCTPTHPPEEYK